MLIRDHHLPESLYACGQWKCSAGFFYSTGFLVVLFPVVVSAWEKVLSVLCRTINYTNQYRFLKTKNTV